MRIDHTSTERNIRSNMERNTGDKRLEIVVLPAECNYRDTIYHDIDVDKEISFNSKWCIDKPYADNEANDMHENVVEEITQMLIDNKI